MPPRGRLRLGRGLPVPGRAGARGRRVAQPQRARGVLPALRQGAQIEPDQGRRPGVGAGPARRRGHLVRAERRAGAAQALLRRATGGPR